jgi:hypothetical protein
MLDNDFPALYRSADELSLESQTHFFQALRLHLGLLVIAAIFSLVSVPHRLVAVLQLVSLLGALSCSIYLFSKRPDRFWYAGRAVAESIKTITWRFVCRAEPFQANDAEATHDFQLTLKAIVDQNKDVAQALTTHLDEPQITDAMRTIRALSLEDRRETYATKRIKEQLSWYARKAAFNRMASNGFFWALIVTNGFAVLCAILRIVCVTVGFWPTDILVALAASLLSWMQAKRFSELASSYALAAHEIGLIREQSLGAQTDVEFSDFVGDSENAFSREHTQWVARKDV